MPSRRSFLQRSFLTGTALGTGAALPSLASESSVRSSRARRTLETPTDEALKKILEQPVLRRELISEPVVIESMDLLKNGDTWFARARSSDGAEGYAVSNWSMPTFWPVFVGHVGPYFEGKDVRDLDRLVQLCFEAGSHYKMQSMAIWAPIATAEFAALDLLGRVSDRSVRELLGPPARDEIEIYWANNFRGQSAEESVRRVAERYEANRPPAVKVKVGGRMSAEEEPAGRSERMIPMLRERLGEDVVIYADANGEYDVEEAIRIGRMLEEIGAGFFEEPVPFDHLWETKEVADALEIPVAAGEQESSMRRFRWMVANDGAQVLQPDLFYYGGLIRSIKVARMAEAAGRPCTAHVSGGDMGMLYIVHFASIVENAGPHQEYKNPSSEIPFEMPGARLDPQRGHIPAPEGPGLGVHFDPDWIAASTVIEGT